MKFALLKIINFFLYIFAFPFAVTIWLLRPLVKIRLIQLVHTRIGHFVGNLEVYLCERDAGFHEKRRYDIFHYENRGICNKQVDKMWRRVLPIIVSTPLSILLNRTNRIVKIIELPRYKDGARFSNRDIMGALERSQPHLSFTDEEKKIGGQALSRLGVPSNKPYICLLGRDSAYLNKNSRGHDYSYHDYRNVNIVNYVKAAEFLADKGYYVLRMGNIVGSPLSSHNKMIIDYATSSEQSDFLDIFISANCRFFISTCSGLDAVPCVFRKPIVCVNGTTMEYAPTFWPYSLYIPKKLFLKSEKRFMSFKEVFECGAGVFVKTQQFYDNEIELIENTPEEVQEVVEEMESRLCGTWVSTKEDIELQDLFWKIFPKNELHGKISVKIGAVFLRNNKNLLM